MKKNRRNENYFQSDEYKNAFNNCEQYMCEQTIKECLDRGQEVSAKLLKNHLNDLNLIKTPLTYEPLRKSRWVLFFPNDENIKHWWVKSINIDYVKHELDIDFVVHAIDEEGEKKSTMEKLINYFNNGKINPWLNIGLEMLDESGVVCGIQRFTSCDCIDFQNKLDYSDNDVMVVKMIFKYKSIQFE